MCVIYNYTAMPNMLSRVMTTITSNLYAQKFLDSVNVYNLFIQGKRYINILTNPNDINTISRCSKSRHDLHKLQMEKLSQLRNKIV